MLGFLAGSLSLLSPCVLPLLPVIVASALHHHARGPLALAAGVVVSSTAVGLVFASLGFAAGVDRDAARTASGVLMAGVGVVLLLPPVHERVQAAVAGAIAPISGGASALTGRVPPGLLGQFLIGGLLGAVWVPCTGPTLAAAITLAGRGEDLGRAGTVMVAFGVGAAVPLLLVAYGSRRALAARSRALEALGRLGRPVMGAALLVIGTLTLSGLDKRVETQVIDHMPDWLVALTTRF